jgi:SAM-dependent methyltransferase
MTMPDVPDIRGRLQWIYSSQDNQDLEKRYDTWAKEYDQDLLSYGYKGPSLAAGLLCRYLPRQAGPVLDAGAGTGIIGEIMAPLGYEDLVAIDLSQGMLELARSKGPYKELRQMVMGERLDFPDDRFAATMAIGVLTHGHAPPDSLDELIRVTKPGGYIVFSMRTDAFLNNGFKEKQDALEQGGRWRLVEATDPVQSLPLAEEGTMIQMFAYQVV